MIFWKGENTSIRFNNWKLIQMGRRWRERRKKRGEEKVINLSGTHHIVEDKVKKSAIQHTFDSP